MTRELINDKDKSSTVVKIPGLSYGDFSRTGKINSFMFMYSRTMFTCTLVLRLWIYSDQSVRLTTTGAHLYTTGGRGNSTVVSVSV